MRDVAIVPYERFGPIRFGMTEEEIITVLGQPWGANRLMGDLTGRLVYDRDPSLQYTFMLLTGVNR